MIVRHSHSRHPEFDLAGARRVFTESGHDGDLRGESITSPHSLFSVESMRDQLGLRIGDAFPTDIFVFGKGEPERRDVTKIGGLPYWPLGRPWPMSRGGDPYQFLAQFNFVDSADLVSELPGTVLLLFIAGDDWLWEPDRIHFVWLPLGLAPIEALDPSLIATSAGPFFGAIYRSADYPGASDKARDSAVEESYNLPILNGTKIGGLPHYIQRGEEGPGEFLCQLSSVQAAPDVPYPWVNVAAPMSLDEIYEDHNEVILGDLGNIYVFRDGKGDLRSIFQCY